MMRVLALFAVLWSSLLAASLPAADVRTGAAAVNLEADDSMVIAGGIGPGKATGQEGLLRVVAVVLDKPGAAKVAIVAADVLFVTRDFVDAALVQIEKSTGIPPGHVLVNATHTHHAPCTATVHGYVRDDVFVRRMQDAIVKAVEDANARLDGGDSECLYKLGHEDTVGANSRVLLSDNTIWWTGPGNDALRHTGPFDPQLPVLAFRGSDQKLRALIYNHSTHTIGTRKPGVRSPSFYGLAAQELETELGGTVSFLEGASGSTHNITGVPTDEAVRRMKKAVTEALSQAEPHAVTKLVSIKRPFSFKVRTFDESVEDEKVSSYCRKRIPAGADGVIEVFRNMRRQLKPEQGKTRETVLQAIRIGDVAIVGVPAEYFTIFGVDIKKRSPFHDTMVAELANDWIGYLPNLEAHELGGYQTWMGLHSYAEPGTGERIADSVVGMLEELARP
jgi:neutral ceramidase